MGAGLTYSIHPDVAQDSNSWSSKLWLPAVPIDMTAGETWEIDWRFDRKTTSQFEFRRVDAVG